MTETWFFAKFQHNHCYLINPLGPKITWQIYSTWYSCWQSVFQQHVALLNKPYDDKYVEFDRDIAEDKLQSDLGKCYIWGLSGIHNISKTVLTYASEVQRLEVKNAHLWEEQPEAAAYIDWES